MNWLIWLTVSIVLFSLTSIFQKTLLKEEQSEPVVYGFLFQIIIGILFLIYALATDFQIPPLGSILINLVAMSLFYALANLTLFKALQTTQISEVAVLMASKIMWTVIASFFLLEEKITLPIIFGTLLVISGIILVSLKKGKWNFHQGHFLTLLSAFFFGVGFANDAFLLRTFNVQSYMVLAFFFPGFLILFLWFVRESNLPKAQPRIPRDLARGSSFFKPKSISKLKLFLSPKRLIKMLITCLFYAGASMTIGLAYKSGGYASQIAPLGQTSIILTILLGFLFLKERENLVQKIIGAIVVFMGVFLLR